MSRLGGGRFPSELPRLLSLMLQESLRFSSWGTEGRLSTSGSQAASQDPQPQECGRPWWRAMLPSTLPTDPWVSSLVPHQTLLLPSLPSALQQGAATSPSRGPVWVLDQLGQGLWVQQDTWGSTSGALGRRGGTRAVLSITLGSGSSEMD